MKKATLILVTVICYLTCFSQEKGTFKDPRDGKIYKTVKIGNQTWFAENLAFKPISGNNCAPDNDKNNIADYGYFYDYETAKNVCPIGWHLPSNSDWQTLIDYLGGESIAGGKLKETGTAHWDNPNTGATNESGFTALPGGQRTFFGQFQGFRIGGFWWSSTDSTKSNSLGKIGDAWSWQMWYDGNKISHNIDTEVTGFSVRCIKDN